MRAARWPGNGYTQPSEPARLLARTAPEETLAKITFPVEAGHIMLFARAVGDTNPVYNDAEAAKKLWPIDGTPDAGAWVSLASVLLNLDEFITRE